MKFKILVLFVSLMATQAIWGRPFCTVKDVRGPYAFLGDGLVLVPAAPISGPFMRLGWFKADGKGNVEATTLAVYNGINFGQEILAGTYTVSEECTIELSLLVPAPIFANASFKGRVANDGEDVQFFLLGTENPLAPPITTVIGHGRRQKLDNCGVRDLEGAYRVEVNGWLDLPPFGTGTPVRLLGRVLTDGKGDFSASLLESFNGIVSEEDSLTGSYEVYPDCTFAMNFSLAGSPMVLRGSLIGLGREAFVVLDPPGITVPDPQFGTIEVNGTVATGMMIQESVSNADR